MWAENEHNEPDIFLESDVRSMQNIIYVAVPLGVFLGVLILSTLMVNRSLRIEPIMILGGKDS